MFETAVEKSARGEWNDALELFVRSRALVDRPVTALNQALMLARLSRMREAIIVLAEAQALTRAPEDDEMVSRIEQLRAEIAPLVGELVVRVEPANAVLSIDGVEQPAVAVGTYTVALDPGPHRVEAKAQAHASSFVELRLGRGERRTMELILPRNAEHPRASITPAKAGVTAGERNPTRDRPLWRSPRLWGPVGAVVAGAVVAGVLLSRSGGSGGDQPNGGTSGRVLSPP